MARRLRIPSRLRKRLEDTRKIYYKYKLYLLSDNNRVRFEDHLNGNKYINKYDVIIRQGRENCPRHSSQFLNSVPLKKHPSFLDDL